MLPWIFVNGVTFVIFCCTLLVPLAILWFFLVKNMVEIYRDLKRRMSIMLLRYMRLVLVDISKVGNLYLAGYLLHILARTPPLVYT